MRKSILLMSAGLIIASASIAQRKKGPTAPQPADTTKKPVAGAMPPMAGMPRGGAPKAGPKPYNEVVTSKAVTRKGMFTVHKVDDRYLFEIPDSLIARDILAVSRISKSATGGRSQMMGYGGDQINESVIRFEKGPDDRIFLKSISYTEMSSDTTENGMYKSVINSNLQPIASSFNVAAYNKDKNSFVIDVTEYIAGDNDILFFEASSKRALGLSAMNPGASYVVEVKSFPSNVEIKTVKTYTKTSGAGMPGMMMGGGSSSPATFELNSSLVLLPETPMKSRYFDPRVGYFATGYTDFDANPQGVKKISMITRWKLEPKPEDVEKYKRGELVEPKEPIVYYIDPATPKKWVPYLIAGVNDWQVAFEKAGFKNAIIAKEAPKNDSTWSVEDARHNVIVYKPSDIPNASGPHVHDPRSGEIIETHVNWYHNVMSLLRNWYMIQAAAVDPKARKMQFDDELMGQLIRFVSSHEVGHTLGLRHNFGSSSTVPVENLRNKAWVEANGHTPSIMDYARFNYVAQPEDGITEKGIFPRIGDYDIWAIEWGYKWKPEFKTAAEEASWSNKWIIERLTANKRLWFGTEMDRDDPRCQNEDLGDNAMKASTYGIKNLKRVLAGIPEWSKEPNEDYDNLTTLYKEVVGQYQRYMGHVVKNIGGIETTPKTIEQGGNVYEFTSKARQKEAMAFLQEQLFTTPSWLLDYKLLGVTGVNPGTQLAGIQVGVASRLLNPGTLGKLDLFEATKGSAAYTSAEMLSDLKKAIWSELASHAAIDPQRRMLQKGYVDALIAQVAPAPAPAAQPGMMVPQGGGGGSKISDATSLLKGHARSLMAEIKAAASLAPNQTTRLHLQDIAGRLSDALDKK
ncbi:MAG: zinc-dependent metalloprotease [Chitinophagaceae bacterium]|nr:zinc-dependent metalloprotease [Chitinophagaceae bacterium]